MIRKPSRLDAKRLAVGSLVAATSFAGLGVAFASSADAASTALSNPTPTQVAYAAGSVAYVDVTSTGTPTHLEYFITAGPDQTSGNGGQDCAATAQGNNVYRCEIDDNAFSGNSGTDSVTIFDDQNNNNVLDTNPAEPSVTTTLKFGGAINSLSVSPTGGTVGANTTRLTTVTAKDNSTPAIASVGSTVYATYTETFTSATANPANPLSFDTSTATGGDSPTNVATGTPTLTSGTTYTATLTGQFTVKADGTIKSGVVSTTAGSVTDKFANSTANPASVQTTDTYTVAGGQSGNNAVKSLSVTPATASAGLNGTVTYTVTALDATTNGNAVGGATVQYSITGGPADNSGASYPTCGTTANGTGTVTCTITNGGTAGTDNITFFVNQTTQATQTPGPDAGEPTATATASFAQSATYDQITLTCNDQTVNSSGTANGASTNCYVPTTTTAQPVTFTVTVNKANGQGVETGVSGAVVNLTAPSTATLSSSSVTTGTNGTATFTLTPKTAPVDGSTYAVTAIVGTGSSYIGSGSSSATATVHYVTAGTHVQTVTLSPRNQSNQVGGTATVTATAKDRFGNVVSGTELYIYVQGRNNYSSSNFYTNAQGTVTYTYQDTGSTLQGGQDTIGVYSYAIGNDTDFVNATWVLSATPSQLTFAVDSGCPTASTSTSNYSTTDTQQVSNAATDEVCATVQNANGDPLPGTSVKLSVDKGFISENSGSGPNNTAPTTTSVTDAADSDGSLEAYVGSTVTGTQTVTATVGSLTKTVTITYTSGDITSITISPTTATVAPGGTQKFTATAKDSFGNLATFQYVTFVQSGPGNIGGASSTNIPTDANGQASVTLSVPAGATGSGSVTVYPQGLGGTPNAVATYTVGTAGPATVSVTGGTVVVRNIATVTATVKDNGGNPIANQVVNFAISGAQSTTGTAATNASGVATFSYRTTAAGTDTVTAGAGSVSGTGAVTVQKQSVSITFGTYSPSKGKVTLVAIVSPASGVVVGQKVGFYQKSGSGYIGPIPATIDSKGRAEVTVSRTSGLTYTFHATVAGTDNVNGATSGDKSVKVK